RGRSDDGEDFLAALAALHEAGAPLVWGDAPARSVDLPTYRFVRRDHWAADDGPALGPAPSGSVSREAGGVLGPALHPAGSERTIRMLSPEVLAQPIWQGHRVFDDPVLPATGLLGLGLEAAQAHAFGGEAVAASRGEAAAVTLSAVHFTGALRLADAADPQLELEPAADGSRFRVLSRSADGEWQTHCVGRLAPASVSDPPPAVDLEAIRARCTEAIAPDAGWARLAAQSVTYGPAWRLLEEIRRGEDEVLARIRGPEAPTRGFAWDPVVADACIQASSALFLDRPEAETYLPASVGEVVCHAAPAPGATVFAHLRTRLVRDTVSASIDVCDEAGRPLLTLVDLRLRPISEARWHHERVDPAWFYRVRVEERRVDVALPQPRPAQVVDALAPDFRRAAAGPEQRAYAEVLGALDAVALDYARLCRFELGGDAEVRPRFRRLGDRIAQLADRAEGSGAEPVSREAIAARLAAIVSDTPSAAAEAALLERCGASLAAVLRGEVAPLSLLFPGGDGAAVEALYGRSVGARLMNEQVAAAFARLRARGPTAERPLRVLEVGAGTGATTSFLYDQLDGVDYTMSDVAPLLVERARERFGDADSIRFERFDVTEAPEAQGFAVGSFDVVVAANVLHATPELRTTLERVGALLAPGGSLLLLESTRAVPWLDLIFGLTEGWWAFEDEALRPDHPLLSSAQWVALLEETGFEAKALSPGDDVEAAQGLIVARRPETPIASGRSVVLGADEALSRALATALDADTRLDDATCADVILVPGPAETPAALATEIDRLLATIRTLVDRPATPRLTVVTRGATGEGDAEPTHAVLAGLARTARLEHPALDCARIDVEASAPLETQVAQIVRALASPVREARRLRADGSRVERLARLPLSPRLPRPDRDYRIEPGPSGDTQGVRFVPAQVGRPGPGEVVVEVLAAGLNFIDVLDAMGMLPFERGWLGVECCGRVVDVGEGVVRCAVGDRVIALCEGSFRDRAIVRDAHLARLPDGLSPTEGATLPAAFLTAWQALVEEAALEAGQSVLIHAGAGGTGMAAIQVARARGARVFATASRDKWAALEALGVEGPLDSRRAGFGEAIRARTDGRGVDVVLNSLTGDFIDEGLHALAKGGTFLEIGKRDLRSEDAVRAIREDVDYRIVDLMTLAATSPERITALFDAFLPALERGALRPLPRQTFAVGHADAALRFMRETRHTGKIVLDFDASGAPIRPDASYLVTGGFGGLGLATARWLADRGASTLVLLGRRVPQATPVELVGLAERGVEVVFVSGDVAEAEDVARAIAAAEARGPLRGVVHAAGVLEDGLLKGLDAEKVAPVLRPKVEGARQLHRATREHALDFFVLYSSAASLLGSPGQGAHVAANGFLDALATHRRRRSLPALCINWGPWSETGSAANEATAAAMRSRGIGPIPTRQGLAALGALLARADVTQVGVVPIDWSQAQGAVRDPFFSLLAEASGASHPTAPSAPAGSPEGDFFAGLARSTPRRRRAEIRRRLQREIARVLGLPEGELPSAIEGFFDLGLDSLMAVDLTARLESSASLAFSSTTLFEYPNIAELADHLDDLVFANASEPVDERHGHEAANRADASTSDEAAAGAEPATPDEAAAGAEPATPDEAEDLDAALAAELEALDELLHDGSRGGDPRRSSRPDLDPNDE
ncbi:MAG: SDR family NAD(P)-dependent oxidoreductase, partial [Myxococcota bacterium]